MKKMILLSLSGILISFSFISAQEKNGQNNKTKAENVFTPYIAVYAGGCVYNPFQFVVGIQKPLQEHLNISYDVHYWKTGYESYCDDKYSKGIFRSVTPSVKIIYNTGKKEGKGLMAGLGLGYMFAKDRGTEQSYLFDQSAKTYTYGNVKTGKWDFSSIAPSFSLGIGFRVFKLPASFNSIYYFANSTEGWMPAAGGVGFKLGFRKVQ